MTILPLAFNSNSEEREKNATKEINISELIHLCKIWRENRTDDYPIRIKLRGSLNSSKFWIN
jgi:hypothetical protein